MLRPMHMSVFFLHRESTDFLIQMYRPLRKEQKVMYLVQHLETLMIHFHDAVISHRLQHTTNKTYIPFPLHDVQQSIGSFQSNPGRVVESIGCTLPGRQRASKMAVYYVTLLFYPYIPHTCRRSCYIECVLLMQQVHIGLYILCKGYFPGAFHYFMYTCT